MLSRFGLRRARSLDGDAAKCDLLALAGKDRWMEYGEDMFTLASANTPEFRLEFKVLLDYLRLDVSRALAECRTDYANNAPWGRGFRNLAKVHLESNWHLLMLRVTPAMVRLGFPGFGSAVKRHVMGSYTGMGAPTLSSQVSV